MRSMSSSQELVVSPIPKNLLILRVGTLEMEIEIAGKCKHTTPSGRTSALALLSVNRTAAAVAWFNILYKCFSSTCKDLWNAGAAGVDWCGSILVNIEIGGLSNIYLPS